MSRLRTGGVFSQMPYSAAIGFQFIFGKFGYRCVKFPQDSGLIVGQCTGNRHGVRYMVAKQIDLYVQSVYECPHLNQALYLRLFGICAVQDFLVKL